VCERIKEIEMGGAHVGWEKKKKKVHWIIELKLWLTSDTKISKPTLTSH
jgi:hypothetical protein